MALPAGFAKPHATPLYRNGTRDFAPRTLVMGGRGNLFAFQRGPQRAGKTARTKGCA